MTQASSDSWWKRNWKWFVPAGCLSLFGMCLGGMALTFFGITSTIRATEPYSRSVASARANPVVLAALGEPIEEGMFPKGSVQTSGPSGRASYDITLSGPRGEGHLFVEAQKLAGEWTFQTLIFEGPNGERTPL